MARAIRVNSSPDFSIACMMTANLRATATAARLKPILSLSFSLPGGTIDLETGVVGGARGPEVPAQALFRDRFVGVARMGHLLSQGEVTPAPRG